MENPAFVDVLDIGKGAFSLLVSWGIQKNPIGILAHLLRMVSWNLNTLRFGGAWTPQSLTSPNAQCMVYLPTFTPKTTQFL